MRFDILALALLALGRLTVGTAADPAPATQPERAAVTDSASPTHTTTAVPAASPASSPAAHPADAATAAAPELSPAEQRLINLGYKPQMRNGEKIYCRREAALGSRISSGQHCGTAAELATAAQQGKDYLDRIHQTQVNPTGH